MESADSRLSKIEELVQENHRILRRLQSAARWGRFFHLVKWLLVIGASLGLYYYLNPLLEQVLGTYRSLLDTLGDAGNSLPFLN